MLTAVEKLPGKTKIVATKVLSSPQWVDSFYRVEEAYIASSGGSHHHSGKICQSRRKEVPGRRPQVASEPCLGNCVK